MESIIGIISGVIAIIGAIIAIWEKCRKPKLVNLMNQLVDKKLSEKEHRKVLKKMSLRLLRDGKRIDDTYIENFSLRNRGKEAIFADLCNENKWEQTPELSMQFLGYISSKKIDNAIETNVANSTNQSNHENKSDMELKKTSTESSNKQTVYFSELLKQRYPSIWNTLQPILEKHHINYSFLKGTKDIWCRDYMPIQNTSGKLIQFKYDPSYLKGEQEWEESRSDVHEVCKVNGLDPIFSDINLDGGNALLCDGRAIVSDRIFKENEDHPKWSDKDALIAELSRLLEAEVIIIPAQNGDMTGHADGMVRFVNKNTILGNNRADEYQYWQKGINEVIKQYKLDYIDIPFLPGNKGAIGIYVNYLEVPDVIILPIFEIDGNKDEQVIQIFKDIFPNKKIETINYNDIAKEGGLLNCTTWVLNHNN